MLYEAHTLAWHIQWVFDVSLSGDVILSAPCLHPIPSHLLFPPPVLPESRHTPAASPKKLPHSPHMFPSLWYHLHVICGHSFHSIPANVLG
jgi:hypothetical protein